ncbi:SGNH/GDSL hydrolase family protein [Rhodococcus sp. NCIMB 12038]|uniref:SGNH/GDSL hydrolase family protein n=1 Tax=Rhodococcus sp. NCIMB 12038 TaxID=933800 RepID=UPI0015C671C7|nr:SGNH/GDSL hydrolase family protein [Rhodococcus sp. NCIMB 12038]
MSKKWSRTVEKRDPKTIVFWAFMAVAIVVGVGMYWATSARTSEADVDYVSTYTPAPAPTLPATPVVKRAPNLLFYGDTLTVGSFTNDDAGTFRGRIVAAATESGPATPIVMAKSGIRTGSFASMYPDAPGGIDLAVVELGTNDVNNTPPEAFRGAYSRVVTSVRTANPSAGLICAGAWGAEVNTTPYDDAIRQVCRDAGGTYVPLYSLYINASLRGPEGAQIGGQIADNFHPNDLGHEAIANALLGNITFE